jgi:hypothetical protein
MRSNQQAVDIIILPIDSNLSKVPISVPIVEERSRVQNSRCRRQRGCVCVR